MNEEEGLILAGTLIIVPVSVLSEWEKEIDKHLNKERINYYEYHDF